MSTSLKDLFSRYADPPSPLHEAVQAAARQAGWIPSWDNEEQQSQKRTAGKISGVARAWRAELRHTLIPAAFARLKPSFQYQPYSDDSIDALRKQYLELLADGGNNLTKGSDDFVSLIPLLLAELPKTHRQALTKVGRETLRKDLKALGIRSKHRIQRSG